MKKTIESYIKLDLQKEQLVAKEFDKFARNFKRDFTRFLVRNGAKAIDISIGFFFITGYFKLCKDLWFFSTGDLRKRKELYIEIDKYTDSKYGMYIPVKDADEFIEMISQKMLAHSE